MNNLVIIEKIESTFIILALSKKKWFKTKFTHVILIYLKITKDQNGYRIFNLLMTGKGLITSRNKVNKQVKAFFFEDR